MVPFNSATTTTWTTTNIWADYHASQHSHSLYINHPNTRAAWIARDYPDSQAIEKEISSLLEKTLRWASDIKTKYNLDLMEVHAAKHLFKKLKNSSILKASTAVIRYGISAKLPPTLIWPADRRNTFLIIEAAEEKYIADPCGSQHGGQNLQKLSNKTQVSWVPETTCKTTSTLTKKLLKLGYSTKDVRIKDAMLSNTLSNKYSITSQTTRTSHRLINPQDAAGVQFLESFEKKEGFRACLAQLMLDQDPRISSRAKEIAEIFLPR